MDGYMRLSSIGKKEQNKLSIQTGREKRPFCTIEKYKFIELLKIAKAIDVCTVQDPSRIVRGPS